MKKNLLLSVLLIVLLISGLSVVNATTLNIANASTTVNSMIITSDTTWTKANSPYTLTGNVLVDNGVTLTIEPGVIINLGKPDWSHSETAYDKVYYIMVNGTLHAQGLNDSKINFDGGYVILTDSSIDWNEQTKSGCIIENTILSSAMSLQINEASPKISNSLINATVHVNGGSPVISGNTIIALGNTGTIIVDGGSPVIVNNEIEPRLDRWVMADSEYGIWLHSGTVNALISDNNIQGFLEAGIRVSTTGTATIERNFINNDNDIVIDTAASALTIRNNTIVGNFRGIVGYLSSATTVVYNNFLFPGSNPAAIYLESNLDVNAAYNWWETNNASRIAAIIHDFDDDFRLGKVTFEPFLTDRNLNAMPDPNAPIPSPDTSPSPSQNPTPDQNGNPTTPQTDFYGIAIAVFVVMLGIALLIIGVVLIRKKNRQTNNYAAKNHDA